jgi:hypothetical protein
MADERHDIEHFFHSSVALESHAITVPEWRKTGAKETRMDGLALLGWRPLPFAVLRAIAEMVARVTQTRQVP